MYDCKEKLPPGNLWRTIVSKALGFIMIKYTRHYTNLSVVRRRPSRRWYPRVASYVINAMP